jgi:hypothetical protein
MLQGVFRGPAHSAQLCGDSKVGVAGCRVAMTPQRASATLVAEASGSKVARDGPGESGSNWASISLVCQQQLVLVSLVVALDLEQRCSRSNLPYRYRGKAIAVPGVSHGWGPEGACNSDAAKKELRTCGAVH